MRNPFPLTTKIHRCSCATATASILSSSINNWNFYILPFFPYWWQLCIHKEKKRKVSIIFLDKHCFCILTGTAAISVGLSTVQSPLLPFLILLDCNKEKMHQFMKLKTQQSFRKRLRKEWDILAFNLFTSLTLSLRHFLYIFFPIVMEKVMNHSNFNQNARWLTSPDWLTPLCIAFPSPLCISFFFFLSSAHAFPLSSPRTVFLPHAISRPAKHAVAFLSSLMCSYFTLFVKWRKVES